MRHFLIIIFIFLSACDPPSARQESKKKIDTKLSQKNNRKFDTLPNGQRLLDNEDSAMDFYYKEVVGSDTLKGGDITCYGIDDSMKYFYLRRGDKLFPLNKTPVLTSTWSLGILEKDFTNFFITRIDNGNGVPETYQIFDKDSGKNILGDKITAWNFKFLGDTLFMLYDNHTVDLIGDLIKRKNADSIFLYNTMTKKRQGFQLPSEISNDSYIDLKKVTKNSFTISFMRIMSDGKESLLTHSR